MIRVFLGGSQIEIVVGWLSAWIVLQTAHQLSFYQTQCTSAICRTFQTDAPGSPIGVPPRTLTRSRSPFLQQQEFPAPWPSRASGSCFPRSLSPRGALPATGCEWRRRREGGQRRHCRSQVPVLHGSRSPFFPFCTWPRSAWIGCRIAR